MADKFPVTRGVRMLKQAKVKYRPVLYDYQFHGGTQRAASELGVDEHCVIKTIVLLSDSGKPVLVLMHGDREVSVKNLARHLKVKRVTPCKPEDAERITGYQTGGISPFGTRSSMRVLVQKSVLELPEIYINAGKRGFLVAIDPQVLLKVVKARAVEVST